MQLYAYLSEIQYEIMRLVKEAVTDLNLALHSPSLAAVEGGMYSIAPLLKENGVKNFSDKKHKSF